MITSREKQKKLLSKIPHIVFFHTPYRVFSFSFRKNTFNTVKTEIKESGLILFHHSIPCYIFDERKLTKDRS